jgi:Protein of unknown function (DUF1570)
MFHGVLLLAVALPAASGGLPNFAFDTGRLDLWEGHGFYVTTATGQGPSPTFAVCSSDAGPRGRRGVLHRTFNVPLNAGYIHFTAAAVRARGCDSGPLLDVVLDTADGKRITKQLRGENGWQASKLLPLLNCRPRAYRFPVADLAGQTVRIAVRDDDDRPGCHVLCSGFRIESLDERNTREFAEHMIRLVRDNHLTPVTRFDSRHFMALSNADDGFSEDRLYNCETIYALFFDHFRKKGFEVREPREKLMVAVFDTQIGFEAYLGGKQMNALRGVYHPPSNRLVVYDYGQNRAFLSEKQLADRMVRQIPSNLERERAINSVNRNAATYRGDANIGTVMHEVAHQLSFNCGLLNRDGDVPVWLAEGLACYCESTENGAWQGIGEPNFSRAATLARAQRGAGGLLPLRSLVENDDWIRKTKDVNQIVLGYAQSWALFSLLMEQRPKSLRKYLALIESRRTADHRLTDFAEVFGSDLDKFETAYLAYVREVVKAQVRTK